MAVCAAAALRILEGHSRASPGLDRAALQPNLAAHLISTLTVIRCSFCRTLLPCLLSQSLAIMLMQVICCRFGNSAGSQQGTPRAWKGSHAAKSGSFALKAPEGESEGQPHWWRAGRLPEMEPGEADEENQQTAKQQVSIKMAICF